jgi:hypothetical protein
MTTTAQDRITKLERLINAIARDAQGLEDFETADQIGRTLEAMREELADLRAELEPEVTEERVAA